ncbi:CU044_2847 family protein [Microcoleus sp. bin38.metabat.b11b12b14.051]|uniref:CU044_2847 family protein n=1 Tax=unclassified Microcoleus TaxID=2642155 RepID=UPI0025CCA215|nr:CU044_2847 family protein [Microcoleus sp. bin38.metabat.b11b12b14.051]
MKRIVEFPLESGDSIFVEVEDPAPIDDCIGLRDEIVQKAQQTFESALEKIKPLTNAIMTKVRSLNEPADEVEVKFGIKMSAELGAVIASGNAEVNYEITLKWQRKSNDDSST